MIRDFVEFRVRVQAGGHHDLWSSSFDFPKWSVSPWWRGTLMAIDRIYISSLTETLRHHLTVYVEGGTHLRLGEHQLHHHLSGLTVVGIYLKQRLGNTSVFRMS